MCVFLKYTNGEHFFNPVVHVFLIIIIQSQNEFETKFPFSRLRAKGEGLSIVITG